MSIGSRIDVTLLLCSVDARKMDSQYLKYRNKLDSSGREVRFGHSNTENALAKITFMSSFEFRVSGLH